MDDRSAVTHPQLLSLSEVRAIQTTILTEVKRVCEMLGLGYFLAYGTLWGAATGGGFLSDDDDIDIALFRDDYETLLLRFNEYAGADYRLLSLGSSPDYYYSFAKVSDTRTCLRESRLPVVRDLGINIDVFPVDRMPEGFTQFTLRSLRLRFLHNARYHLLVLGWDRTADSPVRGLRRRLVRYLADRYAAVSGSSGERNDTWVSLDVGHRIEGSVFDSAVELVFEGKPHPAPAGFHRYLSRLYGDYAAVARTLGSAPAHGFTACRRWPRCSRRCPAQTTSRSTRTTVG